jgi:hypothetical protein
MGDEDEPGRVSPGFGLLAASANVKVLMERLDRLNLSLMDDSDEPEVKHPAFEGLSEELSELHGLAIDVYDAIQRAMDHGIDTL